MASMEISANANKLLNTYFITPVMSINSSIVRLNKSVGNLNTSVSNINNYVSLLNNDSIEAVQLLNELFIKPVTDISNNMLTDYNLLDSSINNANLSITRLNSSVSNLSVYVTNFNTSVNVSFTDVNSSIAQIKSTATSLNTTISNLSVYVTNFNTSVNASFTDVNLSIAGISSTASTLNTTVSNLSVYVTNFNSSVNTSFTDVNLSIAGIRSTASTLNTTVSNLSVYVTNFNSSVNTSFTIINYPNPNFSNVSIGGSGVLFTNAIQSLTASANVNLFSNTTGIINCGSTTSTVNIGSTGGNASLVVFGRVTATTFNSTSDYRLKENIEYNVSLDITRLKPCYYNFVNDKEPKIGFIAHEVQEIIPEAVIGVKDCVDHDLIVPQRIDYNVITAASIHTIQHLIKIIADLENRIENIETNYSQILKVNEHLLKQINDLKSNIL
jgi:hypothetical protein